MRVDEWDAGSLAPELTGDSGLAVDPAWSELAPSLRRVARRMTSARDEQDDLLQEALVALWAIDPTRFDLREHAELAYLRRMLVNRMWDAWRKIRAASPRSV